MPPTPRAWPTNAATLLCTAIDGALLIITLIIFYFFSSKAFNYLRTAQAIKSPTSPAAQRTRKRLGVTRDDMERNHSPLNPFVLYGSWTACSLLLCANTFAFIYTINSQYIFCRICREPMVNVQIVSIGLAKIMSHVIFVRRLEMAFKGAPSLQYGRWVFVVFYTALPVMVAIVAVLVLLIVVLDNLVLYSVVAAAVLGCDTIASIVVLLMFTNKLHQVVFQRKSHSVRDVTRTLELNAPDKAIAKTTAKLTLLSCLNAFGAMCLFIVFTYRGVRQQLANERDDVWLVVYVANVAFMMCATLNCLALYVVLPFANTHYGRMCGCPHSFMKRCCEKGLHGALHKQRDQHVRSITESQRTTGLKIGLPGSKTAMTTAMSNTDSREQHVRANTDSQTHSKVMQIPQTPTAYDEEDGKAGRARVHSTELAVTGSIQTMKQASNTYEEEAVTGSIQTMKQASNTYEEDV